MIIVISMMATGILMGYMLRSRSLTWVKWVITLFIWLLLFLLGLEVGGNGTIMSGLHTIGMDAVVITLFALAGSIIASCVLWRYVRRSSTESIDSEKGGEA